jgi:hypothetical protein
MLCSGLNFEYIQVLSSTAGKFSLARRSSLQGKKSKLICGSVEEKEDRIAGPPRNSKLENASMIGTILMHVKRGAMVERQGNHTSNPR